MKKLHSIDLLIELKNTDEHIEENLEIYHELEEVLNAFEIIKDFQGFIDWDLINKYAEESEYKLLKKVFKR